MTYKEQLRNPKWQKKKTEILIRDNFTCVNCKGTDKNLQVHHLEYLNINVWEYPNSMLITLCEKCHDKETGREYLEKHLAVTLKMNGFLYGDLVALSSLIETNKDFRMYLLTLLRKIQNG